MMDTHMKILSVLCDIMLEVSTANRKTDGFLRSQLYSMFQLKCARLLFVKVLKKSHW